MSLGYIFFGGVIDGDGAIYINPKNKAARIAIVSGSKIFLEQLRKFFGGKIYIKTPNYLTVNNCYILVFYTNYAKRLADILPLDWFTLERKTIRINEIRSDPQRTKGEKILARNLSS